MRITYCANCNNVGKQFWSLNNYYGLSGRFCSDCYNKISHNAYGKPKHPEQYTMILLKLGK